MLFVVCRLLLVACRLLFRNVTLLNRLIAESLNRLVDELYNRFTDESLTIQRERSEQISDSAIQHSRSD